MKLDATKALQMIVNWKGGYEEIAYPQIMAFAKAVLAGDPEAAHFEAVVREYEDHNRPWNADRSKELMEYMDEFEKKYNSQ